MTTHRAGILSNSIMRSLFVSVPDVVIQKGDQLVPRGESSCWFGSEKLVQL